MDKHNHLNLKDDSNSYVVSSILLVQIYLNNKIELIWVEENFKLTFVLHTTKKR